MSDLTTIEKRKLEKLFEMSTGYVLDFSNRTFQEFILDSVDRDIYDKRYSYSSGSKANRLRAFWHVEPNHVVGKLLGDLVECARDDTENATHQPLIEDCQCIVARLRQSAPAPDIEAIAPLTAERDFDQLAKSVRDSIERNEPETGLDRLHTFVTRYVRVLCQRRGIDTTARRPLHSMFGEYVKVMKRQGALESHMAERILKSSISTLDAFNDVRNNRSFAHDNPILNYSEALLIFNHVASSIRFLASLERHDERGQESPAAVVQGRDGVPF